MAEIFDVLACLTFELNIMNKVLADTRANHVTFRAAVRDHIGMHTHNIDEKDEERYW